MGLYSIIFLFESSFPSSLSFLACRPEARRTPKASLMVTIKKQKDSMKTSLERPDLKPTQVVKVVTRAVWLEGKPPVLQTRLSAKAFRE